MLGHAVRNTMFSRSTRPLRRWLVRILAGRDVRVIYNCTFTTPVSLPSLNDPNPVDIRNCLFTSPTREQARSILDAFNAEKSLQPRLGC